MILSIREYTAPFTETAIGKTEIYDIGDFKISRDFKRFQRQVYGISW